MAGDNAFAAHGWLLTAERCWRARCEPRYFTLRDGGALVGAAVCYVMRSSAGVGTLDDVLLGRLRSKAARVGFSFLPALVCGPAQGYGWHIGVDPALDPAARGQVLRRMLDAIEAEADRLALPLSFLQVLDEETDLRALLSARRYLASENVPVAVLDVPWKSLDEYFESLPRRYRKKFRRESRRNIEAGCTTEILGSCAELHQRLMELLDDNARRHGSDGAAFRPELFAELEKNMGDAAVLLAARKQGAVSGVCVALRQDAALIAYAVGVDQAGRRRFHLLPNPVLQADRARHGAGARAHLLRQGHVCDQVAPRLPDDRRRRAHPRQGGATTALGRLVRLRVRLDPPPVAGEQELTMVEAVSLAIPLRA